MKISPAETQMKVRPVPSRPIIFAEHSKRRDFCLYERFCIDIAIKNNWENFSCEECECYEPEVWDFEQYQSACLEENPVSFSVGSNAFGFKHDNY